MPRKKAPLVTPEELRRFIDNQRKEWRALGHTLIDYVQYRENPRHKFMGNGFPLYMLTDEGRRVWAGMERFMGRKPLYQGAYLRYLRVKWVKESEDDLVNRKILRDWLLDQGLETEFMKYQGTHTNQKIPKGQPNRTRKVTWLVLKILNPR